MSTQFGWIIPAVYLAIGVYSFFWIKQDAEFRTGPWAIMASLSFFFWPVMVLIWMMIRGTEHLTSVAAKQSHRDYQIYMREKKDKDLFVNFTKEAPGGKPGNTSPVATGANNATQDVEPGGFQDHNLEMLMAEGKWDEAMRAAKEMRKVAIQTEEEDMVHRYDEYIRRIEDSKRMELD